MTGNNQEVAEKSQIIWVAVKPHAISKVLAEIAPVIKPDHHLVVSAAAGIPIKTLEKVRLIPCSMHQHFPPIHQVHTPSLCLAWSGCDIKLCFVSEDTCFENTIPSTSMTIVPDNTPHPLPSQPCLLHNPSPSQPYPVPQNLPEKCKVFRTMPNTPVVVQNGVTIHAAGTNIEEEDRVLLSDMLSSVGIGMEMQEHYMDIMTALSGGGPSFVSP